MGSAGRWESSYLDDEGGFPSLAAHRHCAFLSRSSRWGELPGWPPSSWTTSEGDFCGLTQKVMIFFSPCFRKPGSFKSLRKGGRDQDNGCEIVVSRE
jgi:hypothetical protein